jgi:hypothetical protein
MLFMVLHFENLKSKSTFAVHHFIIITPVPIGVTCCIRKPAREVTAQAVSRWLPTAAARVRSQVMWDLCWTKWDWGRFSPSTSVSPATSHFTDYSTLIIYHLGLVQ